MQKEKEITRTCQNCKVFLSFNAFDIAIQMQYLALIVIISGLAKSDNSNQMIIILTNGKLSLRPSFLAI
jgi:hypothetical protein